MEIVPYDIKINMHCWEFWKFVGILLVEIDIISYIILEVPLFLKLGVLVDLLDSPFLHPPFQIVIKFKLLHELSISTFKLFAHLKTDELF